MGDLPQPWPRYSIDATRAVTDLVTSGAVFDYSGNGPVNDLEEHLRSRYASPYALTLNSGTSAIYAALAAMGIEANDEVVVAGWTFLATMTPLLWLGAIPKLADVGAGQPVVTVDSIRNALTPKTRAVVVTHLFGEAVDSEGLSKLLRPLGIGLLEDCSHSHASSVGAKPPGAWADIAIFSLGAQKIVSGGHGGALLTRSRELYETALMIGHSKPRTRYELAGTPYAPAAELALGGNLRMSPLAAVLALDHFSRLDEISAARIENVNVLDEVLSPRLQLLRSVAPGDNRTYFDMVWVLPEGQSCAARDSVIADLRSAGVPANIVSTKPLSRTLHALTENGISHSGRYWSQLQQWATSVSSLPEAESLHDRAVSIQAGLLHELGAPYAHQLADRIRFKIKGDS